MVAGLHYTAMVKHYNIVGIAYSGKSVGNYYYCPPFEITLEAFHNFAFVCGVERICGFVKKQEPRIFIYGTCYQQPLLLSLAATHSFRPDYRIILQGQ